MEMERKTWLRERVGQLHEGLGGRLSLDFANTVEPRGGPSPPVSPPGLEPRDELQGYADLVAWTVHAAAVALDAAEALLIEAEGEAAAATAVFATAIALREALYRIFWAVARGEEPPPTDLAVLLRSHAEGIAHARLASDGKRFRLTWEGASTHLGRPLWPIAASAIDLLTEEDLARVKVCPGLGNGVVPCAWLFFDATKGRNRQWCSMADCGNAAKARRRRGRRRATGRRPG